MSLLLSLHHSSHAYSLFNHLCLPGPFSMRCIFHVTPAANVTVDALACLQLVTDSARIAKITISSLVFQPTQVVKFMRASKHFFGNLCKI